MILVIVVSTIAVLLVLCCAGVYSPEGDVDCGFRRGSSADVAGNTKIWLEPPAFKQLG